MTDAAQADAAGNHNQDPASLARIIEGGTWKHQRIVTVIPAGNTLPSKAVYSWMNLIFPPNQANYRFPTWFVTNHEVGIAYSEAIEQIIANPVLSTWEYILTIEADNIVPPDGVLKLLRRMEANPWLSCVSGLYWTKGENGVPQIWGDPSDPIVNFRPQPPRLGQLVECCGTGMGFALWRMSMLADKRIARPLFQTKAGLEGTGTQDLAFWAEARKHGYRAGVDCDVLVGHMDVGTGLVW